MNVPYAETTRCAIKWYMGKIPIPRRGVRIHQEQTMELMFVLQKLELNTNDTLMLKQLRNNVFYI